MGEYLYAQDQKDEVIEYSPEERQAFLDKLNRMNRAEYAAFIRDLSVDIVRDKVVAPLVNALREEQTKREIAEMEARFPDYWKYRDAMINISNANPNLKAEQVYLLARQGDCEQSISNLMKPRGVFSIGTLKRITFSDGTEPMETDSSIVNYGNFVIFTEKNSNKEMMINISKIITIIEIENIG